MAIGQLLHGVAAGANPVGGVVERREMVRLAMPESVP